MVAQEFEAKNQKALVLDDGWAYDKGGPRADVLDPRVLYRYLERRRRRSTRTVIVIVTVMAIIAVTPMLINSISCLLSA